MSYRPTVYLCEKVISLPISSSLISVISVVVRFGIILVSRKTGAGSRIRQVSTYISFLYLAMSENNGNYMMAVTVHDHITSPAGFGNTYIFLTISDVRK